MFPRVERALSANLGVNPFWLHFCIFNPLCIHRLSQGPGAQIEKYFFFFSKRKIASINTALLWQKEASDKSEISWKRAKCVCHFH